MFYRRSPGGILPFAGRLIYHAKILFSYIFPPETRVSISVVKMYFQRIIFPVGHSQDICGRILQQQVNILDRNFMLLSGLQYNEIHGSCQATLNLIIRIIYSYLFLFFRFSGTVRRKAFSRFSFSGNNAKNCRI